MQVTFCTYTLYAPFVHTLKERRAVVQPLLTRVRQRFPVSMLEIGDADVHQRIELGMVWLSPDAARADRLQAQLEAFLLQHTQAQLIAQTREVLL